MVKIIHIFFFLLLFPMSVWAQETVLVFKGAVTDANGKGMANVLCKALNAKDSLLAYSISQSDGQYTLQCKEQPVKLSFAKMGLGISRNLQKRILAFPKEHGKGYSNIDKLNRVGQANAMLGKDLFSILRWGCWEY